MTALRTIRGRVFTLLVLVVVLTIALIVAPRAAGASYLAAFVFVSALPLGGAAALMVGHLTGGKWFAAIKPTLEGLCGSLPAVALLFLPVVIASPALYPWSHHYEAPSGSPTYFAAWFVAVRAAVVLAIWAIGGALLAVASASSPRDRRAAPPLRGWCAAGLIIHFLTVTSAAVDWISFLEPGWHSSVIGALLVCMQGLAALAFAAAVRAAAMLRERRDDASPLKDVGGLILSFALLHAYMMYSQYFVIWNGDLPERTSWYRERDTALWGVAIVAIAVLAFALPFGAMLFSTLKTSARFMRWFGGAVMLGLAIEAAWLVLPSAPGSQAIGLVVFPVMLGCAALGLAAFSPRHFAEAPA